MRGWSTLHRGDSFSVLFVFRVGLLSKPPVLEDVRLFSWEHTGICFCLFFSRLPGPVMWCTVCVSRSFRLRVLVKGLSILCVVSTEGWHLLHWTVLSSQGLSLPLPPFLNVLYSTSHFKWILWNPRSPHFFWQYVFIRSAATMWKPHLSHLQCLSMPNYIQVIHGCKMPLWKDLFFLSF